MRMEIDGTKVESGDILKYHAADGGTWVNAPDAVNLLDLSPAQAAGFTSMTWGLAQCTKCHALTIWTGPDKTIMD